MSCNNEQKPNTRKTIYYWPDGFYTDDFDMAQAADKVNAFDGLLHRKITTCFPEPLIKFEIETLTHTAEEERIPILLFLLHTNDRGASFDSYIDSPAEKILADEGYVRNSLLTQKGMLLKDEVLKMKAEKEQSL